MKIRIFALALIALICSLNPAFAREAIGVIVVTEEEVFLTPANAPEDAEPVPAQIGQEIHLNDTIETGDNARALVLFIDETEITLGENARLTVDEYVFSPEIPAENKGRFSVLRGAFLFASGLIKNNDRPDIKIATTFGTIGIRGTTVWGGMLNGRDYSVFLLDGEVTYQTKRGRVKLLPGEGTDAYSERAIPSRAKIWAQPKIDAATATIALQNTDAVDARIAEFKENHSALRKEHLEKRHQREEQQKEETLDQKQQRMEEKKESGTRYVPKNRTEDNESESKEKPRQKRSNEEAVNDLTKDVPEPAALPVEDVTKAELNEPMKDDSTKTEKTPSKNEEPEVPQIPREGNEAPDFEKWEQQHLENGTPRAPSAL